MHIYQLLMKNRFYRMFEKSTLYCCFYVGTLVLSRMRATLLFDENFTLLKIFISKGFPLLQVFLIIQKADFNSGYVFGMHLYMFSTDIKLGQ